MTIESRSTVRQSKEEYKRERRNTIAEKRGNKEGRKRRFSLGDGHR